MRRFNCLASIADKSWSKNSLFNIERDLASFGKMLGEETCNVWFEQSLEIMIIRNISLIIRSNHVRVRLISRNSHLTSADLLDPLIILSLSDRRLSGTNLETFPYLDREFPIRWSRKRAAYWLRRRRNRIWMRGLLIFDLLFMSSNLFKKVIRNPKPTKIITCVSV